MKKTISAWFGEYWMHILIWSIFISYEVIAIGLLVGDFGHPVNYISHYILTIGMFYLSALVILPVGLKDRNAVIWKLPLGVMFLFVSFLLTNFAVDLVMIHYKFAIRAEGFNLSRSYTGKILYRWVYVFGLSTAYFFLRGFIAERARTAAMEKQRLEKLIEEEKMKRSLSKAQNDFLKAQINPHFLFNTLDFIYHSVSELSHDASEAVMTLSEMMRYAVDSGELEETVVLGAEVEQVEKLIYLYQLRKEMGIPVMTYFADEVMELHFIPLILLTLVENIFKHGNVSPDSAEIQISAVVENEELVIETSNGVNLRPKPASSGAGLRNIRDRLRFAYGADVNFQSKLVGDLFKVRIAIPLPRIETQEERKELLTTNLN